MRVSVRVCMRGWSGSSLLVMVVLMRILVHSFVFVWMPMRVRMRLSSLSLSQLLSFKHVYFCGRNPAAVHRLDPQARMQPQRLHRIRKHFSRYPGIKQSAQKHIAGDSGKAIKISKAHVLSNSNPLQIWPRQNDHLPACTDPIADAGSTSFIEPER